MSYCLADASKSVKLWGSSLWDKFVHARPISICLTLLLKTYLTLTSYTLVRAKVEIQSRLSNQKPQSEHEFNPK